jgi:hypothetical protein
MTEFLRLFDDVDCSDFMKEWENICARGVTVVKILLLCSRSQSSAESEREKQETDKRFKCVDW